MTHHEILGLIAPFTRRGRHADLAASDRIERRLVFKPVEHAVEDPALAGLCETLQLENSRPRFYRLTRTSTLRSGLVATLRIEGRELEALLACIETVPPQRQFQPAADQMMALSYRLESRAEPPREDTLRMVLTSAEARLNGLTLMLKAETGRGYPADITLLPLPDASLELPDDLLATLGWDWTVLQRRGGGWTGTLKARGSEPLRSRRLEQKLKRTVAHLAQVLSEPPRQFHARLARARWGVAFRRTIPLLFCAGLIVGTAGLTFLKIPTDSMFQMLIFNLPPLLLMVLFGMREVPRLEIPPLPRPSTATVWQPGSHPGTDAAPASDSNAG